MERTWRLRCLAYLMDTSPAVLFDVIQLLNCVQFFVTPMDCNTQFPLSATISQSFIKSMSLESMTLSNHLILCHCLLLPSSIFPSIRVFSSESALHISSSLQLHRQSFQWIFRLVSFRVYWSDLLAVQGILKSLLQHHSLKASILQCSAFLWTTSPIRTWLLEKP